MNEENFANVLYKALTTVTKLAELLQIGPSEIARGEKEERNHIFVIWHYEIENSVILRFFPKDGEVFEISSHIADQLQGPERATVDRAMTDLFDWIAVSEQTAQL